MEKTSDQVATTSNNYIESKTESGTNSNTTGCLESTDANTDCSIPRDKTYSPDKVINNKPAPQEENDVNIKKWRHEDWFIEFQLDELLYTDANAINVMTKKVLSKLRMMCNVKSSGCVINLWNRLLNHLRDNCVKQDGVYEEVLRELLNRVLG